MIIDNLINVRIAFLNAISTVTDNTVRNDIYRATFIAMEPLASAPRGPIGAAINNAVHAASIEVTS